MLPFLLVKNGYNRWGQICKRIPPTYYLCHPRHKSIYNPVLCNIYNAVDRRNLGIKQSKYNSIRPRLTRFIFMASMTIRLQAHDSL